MAEKEEYWDIYDKEKHRTGRQMKRNDWCLKDDEYHFDNVLKNNQVLDVYQQGIMGSNVLFLSEMNKDKQAVYSKYPSI